MLLRIKTIITIISLLFIAACEQNVNEKEMKWYTMTTEQDGLPLYLRYPDYSNVWSFKDRFSELLCITHVLDKVTENGSPEPNYNLSLFDFDDSLTELFNEDNEGIIVLVETYGGVRNYWYYISAKTDYNSKIKNIKEKYPLNKLEIEINKDKDWGFLNKYPVNIYNR